MRRDIWGPAVIIPLVVVPVSLLIFLAIAIVLEVFHDFALALGTVMFVGISAGAWWLARRTEPTSTETASEETVDQH
jgi:hypothetical protein